MKNEEILRQGLRAANRVRRFLKLPPVTNLYGGNRGDDASCPITNTIYDDDLDRDRYGVSTGFSVITVHDRKTNTIKRYQNFGSEFVQWFDDTSLRGTHPNLYKPGKLTKVD